MRVLLNIICPTFRQVQWISSLTVRDVRSDPAELARLRLASTRSPRLAAVPTGCQLWRPVLAEAPFWAVDAVTAVRFPRRLRQLRIDGTVVMAINQIRCTAMLLGRR